MENFDLIVIGGGAAGLASAVLAARKGLKTCVLEKGDRVGKKLLLTGNGQGNIANTVINPGCFHSDTPELLRAYLDRYSLNDAIGFFDFLELPTTLIGTKVYPMSLQASSVLDALRLKCEQYKVKQKLNFGVTKLEVWEDKIKVIGGNGFVFGKKVIVAAGGSACPRLNSDGNGYKLFTDFGHKLNEPFPTLVQLKCEGVSSMNLKGIKTDANGVLTADGKTLKESCGELLFTDYGVSGPLVFNLSGEAARALKDNKNVILGLNLSPSVDPAEILLRRKKALADFPLNELFNGYLKKQLTRPVFEKAGVRLDDRKTGALSGIEFQNLIQALLSFKLKVTSTLGFDQAQATIGGLALSDFDENLMSKHVKNLYAAGEILDVDGDCGGYNLFWAWASAKIVTDSL